MKDLYLLVALDHIGPPSYTYKIWTRSMKLGVTIFINLNIRHNILHNIISWGHHWGNKAAIFVTYISIFAFYNSFPVCGSIPDICDFGSEKWELQTDSEHLAVSEITISSSLQLSTTS